MPGGDTRGRLEHSAVAAFACFACGIMASCKQPQEELLMTRRSKVWLVVAVLFTLVNLAGAGIAAADGELLHTCIHVALLLLGAYFVWRLAPRDGARRIWRGRRSATPAPPPELTDRLTHLEQSVDAVAVEVERIGEGQRFMTRIFAERDTPRASGERAADPSELEAREAAPDVRRQ
jgi:hypothetical protein